MSTAEQEVAAPQTDDDRKAAYKEAAIELGKGIAMGLVPFLGQAIDIYDTVESSLTLYNAKKAEDKENAQFDLILAIVGWIPGPGDGVKKSLRIVNKNPQRYAPVLFDLLRFVLQECGIRTSPEALLQEIFNASKLKAQLQDIQDAIVESTVFENLPSAAQGAVKVTMTAAMASLPMMVLIVEKRIKKWSKLQPNSSARAGITSKARTDQPGTRHGAGSQGHARPDSGGAGDGVRSQAATAALSEITNELVGISGEHIADYICVEQFKWGQWSKHDEGSAGRFAVKPGTQQAGKLSKGGSPKSTHKLYKLGDGANGTGIDAVWRAEGRNGGKRYAVVEAKATRDEDAPKFFRRINNTRKPSITSTLGVNAISDPSDLLEPLEETSASAASGQSSTRKAGRSQRGSASTPASSPGAGGKTDVSKRVTEVIVQMSREWIQANMARAVGPSMEREVLSSYSRHLFYAPAFHPSGSPKAHMVAKHTNAGPEHHADHQAIHHEESEVKAAVNKRKTKLRTKYGNLPSLKAEA